MTEENLTVYAKDEGVKAEADFMNKGNEDNREDIDDQKGENEEGEGIVPQPRDPLEGSVCDDDFEEVNLSLSSPGVAKAKGDVILNRLNYLLSEMNEINITVDIEKQATVVHCPKCDCYLLPPNTWVKAELGSKELLKICLSSMKKLKEVRLVGAEIVMKEPHSKSSVYVKLTVHKEASKGLVLEQPITMKYVIEDNMCESCSS